MKLVTSVSILLNEIYSIFYIGQHLLDTCPIQNGLKYGDASSSLLVNSAGIYTIRKVQENQEGLKKERYTLTSCGC